MSIFVGKFMLNFDQFMWFYDPPKDGDEEKDEGKDEDKDEGKDEDKPPRRDWDKRLTFGAYFKVDAYNFKGMDPHLILEVVMDPIQRLVDMCAMKADGTPDQVCAVRTLSAFVAVAV